MSSTHNSSMWNADLPYPLIIAHRGFSDAAPENTMAAFRKAASAGAHMIELDVRESADHRFVVIHDKKIRRTTALRGDVRSYTAAELRRMDNGSWFGKGFAHERIVRLSEALELTKQGMLFNIEIKTDVKTDVHQAAETLLEEVQKMKCSHRVLFTSFNHRVIKAINDCGTSVATGILFNPLKNFRRSPSQLIAHAQAQAFVCSKYQINQDVVADTHKAGYRVFVYGISTERDVRRMLKLEVDGLIANDPRFVRTAVGDLLSTTS
ncbi:MAG TPA: glycerophosphodiester phosphodiesterase family protein [Bacteroidota bacterium]|nr:glycerophosphodiester phosphodiesterase family protein [Bacteroidota bacterium]